jgi:hypothetical protein
MALPTAGLPCHEHHHPTPSSHPARRRRRPRGRPARPLAGYTAGEREVIACCEAQAGRRLTVREIAFQLSCPETVLGPGCEG